MPDAWVEARRGAKALVFGDQLFPAGVPGTIKGAPTYERYDASGTVAASGSVTGDTPEAQGSPTERIGLDTTTLQTGTDHVLHAITSPRRQFPGNRGLN